MLARRIARYRRATDAADVYRHLCSQPQTDSFSKVLSSSLAEPNFATFKRKDEVQRSRLGYLRDDYLQRTLQARVYDVCSETPLQPMQTLSAQLGNKIFLKREDLQPVFSFKLRGAYNKMAHLTPEQQAAGVVACSAGNHAQGVAFSARHLKISAKIVMPCAAPEIKVRAVRKLGAEVILHGDSFDDAAAEAKRLQLEEGRTLVHPFDDPLVIAGQGTIAMEVLKNMMGKPLDAIFCCVGGGGLVAGVASYVKALRPEVKVIGVEAEDAAGMTLSLQCGERRELSAVGMFADGAAVKLVGRETFRIANELVDQMITVSTDEICAAIRAGFNDTRCIFEPAGALAIAGLTKYIQQSDATDKTFVAIASGANMDFDRLRFVSERADSSETLISLVVPERPGQFRRFYDAIYPRNITEVSYRYSNSERAVIYCSFQAEDSADEAAVRAMLAAESFEVEDLSKNELAKVHGRHLVGGRAPSVTNEMLFRFEFPERPGALRKFLDSLGDDWNVSLFHYRNHGADVGRVLVGLQVPPDERPHFKDFLATLGYVWQDEGDNLVYQNFLK